MSEGTRYPREELLPIANELLEILAPTCERIEIVGSLRREKPTCKDIELLFVPRRVKVITQTDLFGTPVSEEIDNAQFNLVTMLRLNGTLQDRLSEDGKTCFGERYQRVMYKGTPVDLFGNIAPAQYGVQKLIRTGPAEFSKRWVTQKNWGHGGWMPMGMSQLGGFQLRDRAHLLEVPEEEDYFRICGHEYIPPDERDRFADFVKLPARKVSA